MSIDMFLLLASVSGQSLLQLTIQRVCEEEPRSESVVVHLPSLRRLWIGLPSDYNVSASDWSSMDIHAPSLLELKLFDERLTEASLLPSLIRGRYVFVVKHVITQLSSSPRVPVRLPQLCRLVVTRREWTYPRPDNRELHNNLIAAHGARVTECTVPMDLVASVGAHCHSLEKLSICASYKHDNQPTLVCQKLMFNHFNLLSLIFAGALDSGIPDDESFHSSPAPHLRQDGAGPGTL